MYLSLGLTKPACEHICARSAATSTLPRLLYLAEWLTIRADREVKPLSRGDDHSQRNVLSPAASASTRSPSAHAMVHFCEAEVLPKEVDRGLIPAPQSLCVT